jgi:putative MATE family efflux protein
MNNIKNSKKGINLLEGSLTKSIIKLGYPIALGSLVQTLYNLADTFWVGRLGADALAAPGISMFILFFFIAIGMGFSSAGTSLVAQYVGAGEKEKANNVAGNLLVYLVIIAIFFCTLGVVFARPLLKLLATPKEAFEMTHTYFTIALIGTPLNFPIFVYQSALNGYGDPMSPLKVTLFSAFVNLILDPVLVFGWFGFPAMGVAGAAITTVITQALGSAIGLYFLFSGKKGIRISIKNLKINKAITQLLVKIGIPTAIGFSGSSVGFIVLMGIINQFGTAVISAYTIGTRIILFYMLPAMGISAAITSIVGQNLGAGQTQRAKDVVAKGTKLMMAIIIPICLLSSIFGEEITRAFIPGDPVVHEIGKVMFWISPLSVVFFGFSSVLEGAFQGSGYTVPVMVAQITRIWFFRIPIVYLLAIVILGGPTDIDASVGIWWGMVLSNVMAFIIVGIWFKKSDWAKARI